MTSDTLPGNIRSRIAVAESGCWLWTGARHDVGYGHIELARSEDGQRNIWLAHRLVWSLLVGELPEHLHHRCAEKLCVNPDHLRPFTVEEHAEHHAAMERRTHCVNGHPFNEKNTSWRKGRNGRRSRVCLPCKAARQRRYNAEQQSRRSDVG